MFREQSESRREGEGKRNGRLVGAAESSGERVKWRRKNLNKLGLPKRKASVPQSEQLTRTPEPQMPKGHHFRSCDERESR